MCSSICRTTIDWSAGPVVSALDGASIRIHQLARDRGPGEMGFRDTPRARAHDLQLMAPTAAARLKPSAMLETLASTMIAACARSSSPSGSASRVIRHGLPAAAAANTDSDRPSHRDGWTNTSAAANRFALS